MHERSMYREGVDFAALAKDCPNLAKYLVKGPSLDFNDPDAVRELTTSLLKRDFGLDVDLPDDRLCPPVPNRLNYILWLQDLLDATSGGFTDDYDRDREVVGLDIGVGSSCIYPLLGCASREGWRFIGTDIDQKSLAYAQAQVERNNLSNRIQIVETTPDAPFFDLDKLGISKLDFTMCNPPFYNSPSSHAPPPSSSLNSTGSESTIRKRLPPYSPTCRGTPTEMCTPGGELAFATRMVHESVLPPVRTRIQWFSIMLGLKSSVAGLISELKARGAANWAVTTFIQGRGSAGKRTGTRRWAVAWSFRGWRPGWGHHVCGIHNPPPGIKPFKGIFELVVPADIQKPKGVLDKLVEVLAEIKLAAQGAGVDRGGVIWWDMKWESHNGKDICDGTGEGTVYGWVTGDLWSRKARRTRERELRETGTGIGVGGVAGSGGERARVPDPQENELDEEKLMGMWFRISVKAAAPTTTTTIDNATTEEDGLDEEMSNAPAWGEHCQGEYTHTHTHTTLAEPEPATDKDLAKMSQQTQVTVRWVRGRPGDSVLFESFCGMLRRKILTC